MANKQQVEKIIAKMGAAFPNWNVDAFTTQVYFEDLRDLDGELLEVAANQCRTEAGRKFAPSTGEIRGTVVEIQKRISGAPSSYQAWQEVCQAFVDVGRTGSPEWSHELVRQTVDSLGWQNLCVSEDQTSERARFVQAYDQFQKRAESEAIMLPEVKAYIEQKSGRLLPSPQNEIKKLTERLSK